MRRMLLIAFAAAMLCAGAETAQAATTYYVSATNGNDSGPGTSANPFLTIQRAANAVAAGDTVVVRAGVYAGARFSTSGTQPLPITITAEPGAKIDHPGPNNSNNDNIWIRDASWITVTGFEIYTAGRAGIAVQAEPDAESHGVVLRNNFCHNNTRWGIFTAYAEGILVEYNECSFSGIEHGIYVSNSSDNPVLRHNRVHDNNASGIQINADPALDGDGIISNATVAYNVIYNNGAGGAAGINLASVVNSLVANNLLYGNHSTGIAGWDDGFDPAFGTHDNTFVFNTVYQATNGRWAMSLVDGSHSNTIRSNILIYPTTQRGSLEVDSSSETGIDSDYNVIVNLFGLDDVGMTAAQWQARGHDLHSTVSSAAAVFVDPASNNFRPKSGGPAINGGIAAGSVTDDLAGKHRPQAGGFDVGAYEFGGVDTAGIYVAPSGAYFLKNANAGGAADVVFTYGPTASSLVSLTGDWNADGVDTIGLYDPASGAFFLKNTNAGGAADLVFTFGPGGLGWVPIVGDWNGDGTDTVGLYDPASGAFFLKNSNAPGAADLVFTFGPGGLGWVPLAGDWNGDGVTTIALYDPSSGFFFVRNANAPGAADLVFSFGPAGAVPLAGDWNADGTDTIGIDVAGSGAWFLRNTNTAGPADVVFTYGPSGSVPVAGDWNAL